ncbi:MAG: hypothetical protein ACI974_001810, partial [Paraglaciecola sp.]
LVDTNDEKFGLIRVPFQYFHRQAGYFTGYLLVIEENHKI